MSFEVQFANWSDGQAVTVALEAATEVKASAQHKRQGKHGAEGDNHDYMRPVEPRQIAHIDVTQGATPYCLVLEQGGFSGVVLLLVDLASCTALLQNADRTIDRSRLPSS